MKLKLLLLSTLLLSPLPTLAGGLYGQTNVYEECFKHVEKYTPGYYDGQGRYIRGQVRVVKERVPCRTSQSREHYHEHSNTDDNSCIEGSILGGILGGGIGAAASRGDGRWWAIPTGIVGGALVGCQIDGG